VVFVTWQVEVGAKGTRHLQGYFVTKPNPKNKNGYSSAWIKNNLNGKMHVEPRKGTHDQAVAYANKTDTRSAGPWTLGEFQSVESIKEEIGERHKKSLADVKSAIDRGATDAELFSEHFSAMLRYKSGFDKYRLAMASTVRVQPRIIVLVGPPGTGKSFKARQIADANGGAHWFTSGNGDNTWWDGYDPIKHKVVVLDDFQGGIKFRTLLRMLDSYPLQVETKGSTVMFNPNIIVITSNKNPNEWYFNKPEDVNHDHSPLLRRVTAPYGVTIEMKDKYVPPEAEPVVSTAELLDQIVSGDFLRREQEVRKAYLGDVSKKESKQAVIDLLTDEELSASADYEQTQHPWDDGASPAPEWDDDFETQSSEFEDHRQYPTPPQYLEEEDSAALQGRACSATSATPIRRTDESQAEWMLKRPFKAPGQFKKVGKGMEQLELNVASRAALKRARTDDDDDDGDE